MRRSRFARCCALVLALVLLAQTPVQAIQNSNWNLPILRAALVYTIVGLGTYRVAGLIPETDNPFLQVQTSTFILTVASIALLGNLLDNATQKRVRINYLMDSTQLLTFALFFATIVASLTAPAPALARARLDAVQPTTFTSAAVKGKFAAVKNFTKLKGKLRIQYGGVVESGPDAGKEVKGKLTFKLGGDRA